MYTWGKWGVKQPGCNITDSKKQSFERKEFRDFLGGPVAKTELPVQGVWGSIPGQGTGSHMLQLRPGIAK